MKDLGKGLATCCMCTAIAVIGWKEPVAGVICAMGGAFATLVIWDR